MAVTIGPSVEPLLSSAPRKRAGIVGWITTTDHKQIAILTFCTAVALFIVFGCIALVMRSQLAQPNETLLGPGKYNILFTLHGSGMIYLVITPLAMSFGMYMLPIQVGSPVIAMPKMCNFAYWVYVSGAVLILSAPAMGNGPPDGWYSYLPLADSTYTPGLSMDFWIIGGILAVLAMVIMGAALLWTALRMRAPGMSLMKMTVFSWSIVVSALMTVAAFPSQLAAMGLIGISRADPALFTHNTANIAYQYLFWFYGHPVVYVMFFPFTGAIAEVVATFSGRKYFGHTFTVFALLAFSTGSMTVFGHHMFTTGELHANNFFSFSSISLSVPAGIEYFGILATLGGGQLVYSTAMCFALAWIPQFLIGGLTGIMLGSPVLDYHFHGSYFVVGHFHYTLFGGSVFGAFAGIYYWFPKVTGRMLREGLGKINFTLMCIGTNLAFFPMLVEGYLGLPRRVETYQPGFGFSTLNLISTVGAGTIALGVAFFIVNVVVSLHDRQPVGDDPWGAGQSLEWATSSPPPVFNFDLAHPIPPITTYAPLLDLKQATDKELVTLKEGPDGKPTVG